MLQVQATPQQSREELTARIDRLASEANTVFDSKMKLIGLVADPEAVKIMLEKPWILRISITDVVRKSPINFVNDSMAHSILGQLIASHSDDNVRKAILGMQEVAETQNIMGIRTGYLILLSCGPQLRLEILQSPWLSKMTGQSEYNIARMIIGLHEEDGMRYIASMPNLLLSQEKRDDLPRATRNSEIIWQLIEKSPKEVIMDLIRTLPAPLFGMEKTLISEKPVMVTWYDGSKDNKGTLVKIFTVEDALREKCAELGMKEAAGLLDERAESAGERVMEDLSKFKMAPELMRAIGLRK